MVGDKMENKLSLVWAIISREVRDQFRDWRITLPIVFLTAVFPFLIGFISKQVVDFVRSYDADIVAGNLVPFFLLVVGFFPATISLVIATESFVGEKERRSIEPLLASPLEDWQIYIGKLIAVMFPPLFGAFIGMFVYLVSTYWQLGLWAGWDWIVMVASLTLVQAFVMVSAAVVVSSQATTVRSANLLTSFIVVPMAFLLQAEAYTMFWGEYQDLWWVVAGLILLAILLIRMGISHFNREELIGQEFDSLNIQWLWTNFKNNFIGGATSLKNWYKRVFMFVRKELGMPFVFMGVLLAGAWLLGMQQAEIYKFPLEFINLDNFEYDMAGEFSGSLLTPGNIPLLWLHNIRAIVIGTVIGIFSFGIAGTLILLLPFVIIGYFLVPMAAAGLPEWKYILGLVMPHGIFEIPAILLVGAAILRIGASLAAPSKGESISDSLLRSVADWAKIMVGIVIPLLLISASIEAMITPRIAIWLLTR